ncbi:MAG: class I SAM-dependent methyltransferase [Gemmatimonadetes bacterium]|nr:class I SAM-dependent methyltransferase [Gemmatimonadota bacterium]
MTATTADPAPDVDLQHLPCKCCGGDAAVYGAVEFNRTCEDREVPVFPPTGVDIPYHRCAGCGFIFTIAFDHFGAAEFGQYIYNDNYPLADPDFAERRPASNAELLRRNFGGAAAQLKVLDYGGGNGLLAERLQALGFTGATTYDPFYAGSERPRGTFDLVTAFEVLEHTPTPRETLADMASLLSSEGMLFCSTLLQPPDIDQLRLRWWYAAPRNGHVSLYSRPALTALAASVGLTYGGGNELLHIFHRGTLPSFATQLVTA